MSRKVRYYSVKRNDKGFWGPPQWARDMGFTGVPCGPDGPDAWAKAEDWNKKLDAARRARDQAAALEGKTMADLQKPGSLAHWYYMWRTLPDFEDKAPATQTEYQSAWKHIGPALGSKQMDSITADDIATFQMTLDATTSPRVRWGTIKKLTAMLNAAHKRDIIKRVPKLIMPNRTPPARTEIWYPQDIEKLQTTAMEMRLPEVALAVWIADETALAPVDIRTLSLDMITEDAEGAYIQRGRTKTGASAEPPLSRELWAAITAYIAGLPFELPADSPFLRRSSTGKAYKDPPEMAKDFRKVREAAFGKGDKRRLMDIRRTTSFEADLGGASPEERGDLLANTIGSNKALDETYSPSNVIKARRTLEKREIGRQILWQLGEARKAES